MIQPRQPFPPEEKSETSAGDFRRDRSRCPACGARRADRESCQRCGSDLRGLLLVERRAEALLAAASEAYASGRYLTASRLASRSAELVAEPAALRLQACASLRAGDYPSARRAARAAATSPVSSPG